MTCPKCGAPANRAPDLYPVRNLRCLRGHTWWEWYLGWDR